MKSKNLLVFGLSLAILGISDLSAVAQNRKPTTAEIQRLRQELRNNVNSRKGTVGADYIRDIRTQAEKRDRDTFVNAWSKAQPQLAPYLGGWIGYEASRTIYPSNVKGRVCVLSTDETEVTASTGILSNGAIHTDKGEVLFKEGNHLGTALLKSGRFISNYETPLRSPTVLKPIDKLLEPMSHLSTRYQNAIINKFKNTSCTALKPGHKPKVTNYGNRIPGTVLLNFENEKDRESYIEIGKTGANGEYIFGKHNIDELGRNIWFSLLVYQGLNFQPVIINNGKIRYINNKYYLAWKIIKVAERRFVLHASRDYYKGGDDYYDVDLRNTSNPTIRKINLATANKLHK